MNKATELKERIEVVAINIQDAYKELSEIYKEITKIEDKMKGGNEQ